jgi:hypothetical protein
MSNDYSWDDVVEKVKQLRDLGYTVLQIEEETQFDYEDILWVVELAKLETMEKFIGEAEDYGKVYRRSRMRSKPKHESLPLTLWGDLDGKTIEQVVAILQAYPAGAVIDARVRQDKWADPEDYFVLTWDNEERVVPVAVDKTEQLELQVALLSDELINYKHELAKVTEDSDLLRSLLKALRSL